MMSWFEGNPSIRRRGARATAVLGINDRGQIVGDYGTKPPVGDRGARARRFDRGGSSSHSASRYSFASPAGVAQSVRAAES
jgi:hypothetical protein